MVSLCQILSSLLSYMQLRESYIMYVPLIDTYIVYISHVNYVFFLYLLCIFVSMCIIMINKQ